MCWSFILSIVVKAAIYFGLLWAIISFTSPPITFFMSFLLGLGFQKIFLGE